MAKFIESNSAPMSAGLARLRSALAASVALVFLIGVGATSSDARTLRHTSSAKKADSRKDFGELPKGPLQIMVNIGAQHVTLYSGGQKVAQGAVATGMPGHPTPMGVFSVIEKDRYHHSNLYSNAPMPFMQRITWSGVALHEGPLPGYPASHGCIRMSHDFASRLWVVTKLGVRVIVARQEVVPTEFSHPNLFVPTQRPAEPPVASAEPEKHAESTPAQTATRPFQVAQNMIVQLDANPVAEAPATTKLVPVGAEATIGAPTASGSAAAGFVAEPLRGSVTSQNRSEDETTGSNPAAPATSATASEKPPVAGEPANSAQPAAESDAAPAQTGGAVVPTAADPAAPAESAPANLDLVKPEPVAEPPKPKAPLIRGRTAEQPAKRTGQVAVFISRKEKKLFVRQGFVPIFDMPVEIDDPNEPLGTHVFTALALTEDGTAMRWNVMSLPGASHSVETPSRRRGKRAPAPKPVEVKGTATPDAALSRIHIPQEAKDRIGELLIPGSSLVVSDQGLGPETGRGTEFVVLTH